MFRLTLFRQQLILILLVLTFELLPLGAMFVLLNHAEAARVRGEQSQRITNEASGLYTDLYDLTSSLTNYGTTRNAQFLEKYRETRAILPTRLDALEDACKAFPQDLDSVTRIRAAMKKILESFNRAEKFLQQSNEVMELVGVSQLQKELTRRVDNLMTTLSKFSEYHHELERAEAKANARTRALTNQILISGILLNLSIAVVSVIFFSRTITDRLRILTDNASRLAKGVPLHAPIVGVDEISSLDQTFHEMVSALKDATDKNRALVDHNPVGLITLDDKGMIVNANTKASEIFQIEPEQLLHKPLLQFVSLASAASHEESVQLSFNTLKERASGRPTEVDGKRAGATFPCELSLSAFSSKSSQAYICNIQDITERRELERLKQEFVSVVSHDLRTPLTSIQACLSMISSGLFGALDDKGLQIARASERETQRLVRLIASLLDVARMEAGKIDLELSDCRLQNIVTRSVQAVMPLASEKKIKIDVPLQEIGFRGDEERLIQVIVNLLSNAIKYSEPGSTIKIEANIKEKAEANSPASAQAKLEEKLEEKHEEKNDRADEKTELESFELKVVDSGCGIPLSARNRIFDRFEQVSSSDRKEKGGTGLGLAICKMIIEAHGGAIGVDSVEGQGSSFWFRLPGKTERVPPDPARPVA